MHAAILLSSFLSYMCSWFTRQVSIKSISHSTIISNFHYIYLLLYFLMLIYFDALFMYRMYDCFTYQFCANQLRYCSRVGVSILFISFESIHISLPLLCVSHYMYSRISISWTRISRILRISKRLSESKIHFYCFLQP